MQKNIEQSLIGQNIYTREVANNALNFGHQLKNIVGNFRNVQKASTIDSNKLQEHLTKNSNCQKNFYTMLINESVGEKSFESIYQNDEFYYSNDPDFLKKFNPMNKLS